MELKTLDELLEYCRQKVKSNERFRWIGYRHGKHVAYKDLLVRLEAFRASMPKFIDVMRQMPEWNRPLKVEDYVVKFREKESPTAMNDDVQQGY